jgi:hypothetical protein
MDAPRIVEIGEFPLFKGTWPETTAYYYAGPDRAAIGDVAHGRFGPGTRHAPGELVIVHTALDAPHDAALLRRLLSPRRARDALAAAAIGLGAPVAARGTPVAVLDMHDEAALRPHMLRLLLRCHLYFKRELPADPVKAISRPHRTPAVLAALDRLRPISLGIPPGTLRAAPPPQPKTTDVFFAGSPAHAPGIRGDGLRQLGTLRDEGFAIDIAAGRLPLAEFLARCSAARLVWSPEGLGWDCFRHYEAAACGAVPVINQPPIRRHAPLREGVHAIYYDVEDDGLSRAVRAALATPDRLTQMANAARAHVLRHHTHEAICRYVVDTCRGTGLQPGPAPPISPG